MRPCVPLVRFLRDMSVVYLCVLHLQVYILDVFSKTKLQPLKGNSEIRKGTK